jgi:hypothetical protein
VRAYEPGRRVRVRLDDPAGHTRAPRYVRGRSGTVLEVHGHHRLPDDVVAGRDPQPTPVYAVQFDARELFGAGDHRVTVNLWHAYLQAEDGHERLKQPEGR